MSSSLVAAVTLAVALLVRDGEASIFSSKATATPKWFSGVQPRIQKVARDTALLERATVVRGGAAPGKETVEETSEDSEAVVEAQDLYLPGLLDTIITRTNKVCRVVSCRIHRLLPRICRSRRSHPPSRSFIIYL
jgi:hypothetical protein